MPGVIWTINFLKAQEFGVTDNVILQDNIIALLLENNGKSSSGKKKITSIFVIFYYLQDPKVGGISGMVSD